MAPLGWCLGWKRAADGFPGALNDPGREDVHIGTVEQPACGTPPEKQKPRKGCVDVKRALSGAVVVITGASSGIGRAGALAFARRGATVVVAARREEPLETLADECRRMGIEALAVPTDVTEPEAVEQLARRAEERFGGIDVWVNNAGVYLAGRFEDTPPEAFRRLMEVNFFGYVYGARAALPRLRARRGALVNIASVDSAAAFPYFSAYVASKWAVRGFSSALRQEYRDSGVDVCAILPASIDTPLFQHAANYTGRKMKALNPTYTPEMVADAMVRGAEHGTREIIVGGAGKLLALQYALAPALAERLFPIQAETDHFVKDESAPPSAGNLFEPLRLGNDVRGGWGGSRGPDAIAGAAAAGVAVLAPALAWLSSHRFRETIRSRLPLGGRHRPESGPRRALRSARRAIGAR
jgi:short-subunit dehydrogenase